MIRDMSRVRHSIVLQIPRGDTVHWCRIVASCEMKHTDTLIENKKGGDGMKKREGFKELYGWDDGKIYFMDEERKKEWCVTDNEELYNQLTEICRKCFREIRL